MGAKITSTKARTVTTASPEKFSALRTQLLFGASTITAEISMGQTRVMSLALAAKNGGPGEGVELEGKIAKITLENCDVYGQALAALVKDPELSRFAAITSFESVGDTDVVLADAGQFQVLLNEFGTPLRFEEAALDRFNAAIASKNRTSDVYIVVDRSALGAFLRTGSERLQPALLRNNTQAQVVRCSPEGSHVATILVDRVLVTERANATRGEGHNWYEKTFPFGALDFVTPLAEDGFMTATYEREGALYGRRFTPFTMSDELLVVGSEFRTTGRILRDDPNTALLVQLAPKASNQVARAVLWAAEYARSQDEGQREFTTRADAEDAAEATAPEDDDQ
ncbi:hypothetical protein HZA86_01010 [Candidatus Uhrbacteria bacterium]|nr:hypothetical protein [Candidatus Uhrbacteria bacterium]